LTIDTEDLLNSILESLDQIEYIKPSDIPNIDLYMDQVTTFMDSRLRSGARNPGDDKILTKTMINNYAKNDLLPPPVKKKYSKEHVLLLIFIYYYKGIMSISDIQTLLGPITKQFFQNGEDFNLESVYEEVFSMEKDQIEVLKADMIEKFKKSEQTFQNAPEENQEFLRRFSFICLLSFDVYVKKLIIEKMVDELGEKED
jgi:Asp-tRNA(Asn)/Glu-tRNA(Gln) amidotransferase C subunit